jgi:hypothetical protein
VGLRDLFPIVKKLQIKTAQVNIGKYGGNPGLNLFCHALVFGFFVWERVT